MKIADSDDSNARPRYQDSARQIAETEQSMPLSSVLMYDVDAGRTPINLQITVKTHKNDGEVKARLIHGCHKLCSCQHSIT